MAVLIASLVASFVVAGTAFRFSHRRSQPGMVEYLYMTGAPGSTVPPLSNFSRCFNGKRVVNADTEWFGRQNDLIPVVGRAFGYKNTLIDLQEIHVKNYGIKNTPCSQAATKEPSNWPDSDLHPKDRYWNSISKANLPNFEKTLGYFATQVAFKRYEKDAKPMVESRGWKLVASARHEGSAIVGGPQVVHLIQHPSTLECVVTFQGSSSAGDWFANFGSGKTDFCGRPEKFHDGLAWSTELSTTSAEFQAKIRPNLPKCRRVIAVGQSQGASQAEYFTACVNQSPPPRNAMYNAMSWVKGTPARLPYL